jgi:hypothetical protein
MYTPHFLNALKRSYRYFPEEVAVVTLTKRNRWQSLRNLVSLNLCYEREWLGVVK